MRLREAISLYALFSNALEAIGLRSRMRYAYPAGASANQTFCPDHQPQMRLQCVPARIGPQIEAAEGADLAAADQQVLHAGNHQHGHAPGRRANDLPPSAAAPDFPTSIRRETSVTDLLNPLRLFSKRQRLSAAFIRSTSHL
jgi:hypothetical protein